jgi:hypothetical protein
MSTMRRPWILPVGMVACAVFVTGCINKGKVTTSATDAHAAAPRVAGRDRVGCCRCQLM